jgi:predicted Zn finger-like uncharacterized protein
MLSDEVLVCCSRCDAKYCVSADLLDRRRLVRCSECGHIWHEDPAEYITPNEINQKNVVHIKKKNKNILLLTFLFAVLTALGLSLLFLKNIEKYIAAWF